MVGLIGALVGQKWYFQKMCLLSWILTWVLHMSLLDGKQHDTLVLGDAFEGPNGMLVPKGIHFYCIVFCFFVLMS